MMEIQEINQNEAKQEFLVSKINEINITHSMIFGRLTLEQKNVVFANHESSLAIIAGPGTGKTATITARIINFLLNGHSPILALTFTRKAANELRNRISVFYSSSIKNIQSWKTNSFGEPEFSNKVKNNLSLFFPNSEIFVCTIHSFCWKIIKKYHSFIGLPKSLEIIDKEISIKLLKSCISEICKKKTILKISSIQPLLFNSNIIDDQLDRDDYDEDSEDEDENNYLSANNKSTKIPSNTEKYKKIQDFNDEIDIKNFDLEKILKIIKILKYKRFVNDKECSLSDLNGNTDLFEIYNLYIQKMQNNKIYMLDYTDLIIFALKLLNNDEIRLKIQFSYPYVFCDEFQDTSKMQLKILELLMRRNQNKQNIFSFSLNTDEKSCKVRRGGITVVGDDDQAIYSWRGVESGIFAQFSTIFNKNLKIAFLTENFRSTSSILDISNKLIRNNKYRIEKGFKTNNNTGIKPKIYFFSNTMDELSWIFFTVLLLKSKYNFVWSDFAILTRTNDILFYIEKTFNDNKFIRSCLELLISYKNKKSDFSEINKKWINMIPDDLLKFSDFTSLAASFDFPTENIFPIDNTSRNKNKNTKDLLNKSEILDILSYCRLIIDETADDCFLRICNRPKRGFGNNTFKVLEKFGAKGISLIRKSTQPLIGINDLLKNKSPDRKKFSNSYEPILSVCRKLICRNSENCTSINIDPKSFKKAKNCIEPLTNLFDELEEIVRKKISVKEVICAILKLSNYLQIENLSSAPEKKRKIENSEQNLNFAKLDEKYIGITSSILELIKYSESYTPNVEQPTARECLICFLQDASNGLLKKKKEEKITLSTIHKSKGLEWKVVFIPRFVESVFPLYREIDYFNSNINNGDAILDEERRIAFVAFTRAKERLFISVPLNIGKPSPFIQEANLDSHKIINKSESQEFIKQNPKVITGIKWKH